jgi:hypothetical protein
VDFSVCDLSLNPSLSPKVGLLVSLWAGSGSSGEERERQRERKERRGGVIPPFHSLGLVISIAFVFCLLSFVFCLLSFVFCLLSSSLSLLPPSSPNRSPSRPCFGPGGARLPPGIAHGTAAGDFQDYFFVTVCDGDTNDFGFRFGVGVEDGVCSAVEVGVMVAVAVTVRLGFAVDGGPFFGLVVVTADVEPDGDWFHSVLEGRAAAPTVLGAWLRHCFRSSASSSSSSSSCSSSSSSGFLLLSVFLLMSVLPLQGGLGGFYTMLLQFRSVFKSGQSD